MQGACIVMDIAAEMALHYETPDVLRVPNQAPKTT